MDSLRSAVGFDIVKSFHEQFAENQNHHQKLFLQVLTILLSVLIGFGYLYVRIDSLKNELNITIETLYWYLIVSMYLLSLAVAIISNMALGFRRDQLMASNIRILSNVMNSDNDDNFFFHKFNPQGKVGKFDWMPEFHIIFLWSLILIKAILVSSVIFFEGKVIRITVCNIDWKLTIMFAVVFISFALDFIVARYYWLKWKKYSDEAPDNLKKTTNK